MVDKIEKIEEQLRVTQLCKLRIFDLYEIRN